MRETSALLRKVALQTKPIGGAPPTSFCDYQLGASHRHSHRFGPRAAYTELALGYDFLTWCARGATWSRGKKHGEEILNVVVR